MSVAAVKVHERYERRKEPPPTPSPEARVGTGRWSYWKDGDVLKINDIAIDLTTEHATYESVLLWALDTLNSIWAQGDKTFEAVRVEFQRQIQEIEKAHFNQLWEKVSAIRMSDVASLEKQYERIDDTLEKHRQDYQRTVESFEARFSRLDENINDVKKCQESVAREIAALKLACKNVAPIAEDCERLQPQTTSLMLDVKDLKDKFASVTTLIGNVKAQTRLQVDKVLVEMVKQKGQPKPRKKRLK
jgi:archaellum component FlaC